MQTPYEETDEEVRRRVERARDARAGWIGTLVGLALSIVALVILFMTD